MKSVPYALKRRRLTWMCAAGAAGAVLASGVVGTAMAVPASAATAPPLSAAFPSAWNSTWSYNAYSTDFPTGLDYFVYAALAVQKAPSITVFVPQLASSWAVHGNNVSIYLHKGAKWQNGQPVTATDVYDTFLLDGAAGFSAWDGVANVTVVSPSEITFTLAPGTLPNLFESTLFNSVIPYPASEYGQFVTPSLKQEDIAYFEELLKNPNAAATSAAANALHTVFTKLASYSPTSIVGNGPYSFNGINTLNMQLTKWDGFYGANAVHVPAVTFYNATTNSEIYSWLFSGHAMFSDVYLTPAILKRLASTPGSHVAAPTAGEQQMVFNDHVYPLNNPKVRQALAYITPRQKMIVAAYGTSHAAGGTVSSPPDGLMASIQGLYLSPAQVASLNNYSYSPAKATALLESAGFHKSGGSWVMPDGKPFKLTMTVVAAYSDIVTAFDVASSAWSAFGIPTTENGVPKATWAADLHSGNFEVANNYMANYDPLGGFNADLGTPLNFSSSGSFKGERGIGFGPSASVPGIGAINVPPALGKEAALIGPGPEMRKLTWDWAQFVDKNLPYLVFGNKVFQFSYSSSTYTDWPASNSWLWPVMSNSKHAGLALAIEDGYIRPKA